MRVSSRQNKRISHLFTYDRSFFKCYDKSRGINNITYRFFKGEYQRIIIEILENISRILLYEAPAIQYGGSGVELETRSQLSALFEFAYLSKR